MKNFLRAFSRVAVLAIATKVVLEILKKCGKRKECFKPEPKVDRTLARYIPTQVILWKRPGVSEAEFNGWKDKYRPAGVTESKRCEYCDDSLILWEGENVSSFISGKGASEGVTTESQVMGGADEIAYYTYNILIDLPEPDPCDREDEKKGLTIRMQPEFSTAPIIIAVLDTGLNQEIKDAYTRPVFSCMPGGELGWNFVNNTGDTGDDHPSMHGTVVTKFIIDQAIKYGKNKINILPVKVHDKYGRSDLLSILCGFAYASNSGARIINASFGFYSDKGLEPPAILADFVQRHLTDKNILLVAAAGNVNRDKSHIQPGRPHVVRDLERNPFFPACLSRYFSNVMAVTTASPEKTDVSPSQNFSNHIVDIGVQCDIEISGDYWFRDSLERFDRVGAPLYVVGSSFATPIMSGILAQYYDVVMASLEQGKISTTKIISNLPHTPPLSLSSGNSPLDDFIVDGNCCEK